MSSALGAIMIYARDPRRSAEFYKTHFGFVPVEPPVPGLITLRPSSGGASIVIHQAAKTVKLGQVGVKLVFAVEDIEGFKAKAAERGLVFGSTHQAEGYSFANAKDPDRNSVCISSRTYVV